MRVLLAGEGANDLGEWFKEAQYRENPGQKGVVMALMERAGGKASFVHDARIWKSIRKYQAGKHASSEARNVLGLALEARRSGCNVVVFVRDRDRKEDRQADMEAGLERAREEFQDVSVVGGPAIECIDAWVLLACGVAGEAFSTGRAKAELSNRGITTTQEKVDAIEKASLDDLAPGSLRTWLDRARAVFGDVQAWV